MTEHAASAGARRSSAFAWFIVILGVLFAPLGLAAPPYLASQGYIRWSVAAFASLISLAEIVSIFFAG